MIPYGMKQDDARKLDHATLEAMRIRAVRSVQAGENPEVVARSLRISRRTIYGWLAQYRRGGVRRDPNARRAFPHHRRPHLDSQPLHRTHRRPETSGPPTQTRSPTTAAATHHRARKDRSPPSQRRVVETFTMPALILLTFFAELGKLG